ncbi:hypothetical protein KR044_004362, partial [Drosophila immigrans]
ARRRSSYNSTSAVNCAAKTIVTITAPPAAAASASALHLGSGRPSSVSTLTLATVPQSMLKGGSVSAANTPLAPATKHTSFALTPGAMGPSGSSSGSGHHVSFMPLPIPLPMMGIKRLRDSNSSLGSPTTATGTAAGAATSSAPSLIEVAEEVAAAHQHAALELRQSVQSQITTLEDVDDVEHSDGDDDDSESESVGMALVQTTPQLECRTEMASSSSSGSVK